MLEEEKSGYMTWNMIWRDHVFNYDPQNRLRGWQNFEKKLSQLAPRQFFFSKFCHPRRQFWAIIENMISPDNVLYYNFQSRKQIDAERGTSLYNAYIFSRKKRSYGAYIFAKSSLYK